MINYNKSYRILITYQSYKGASHLQQKFLMDKGDMTKQ